MVEARFYYDPDNTAKWKPGKVPDPPPSRTTFEGAEYELVSAPSGAWQAGGPVLVMYQPVQSDEESAPPTS
jgi:hypothetical protein